jgi:two-component system, OmpR family, KDP operon response regulator KdpE
LKKPRILIVDDDPAIRKFIKANLEARDYEVLTAVDGEEGVKSIESEMPDLILLDITMPKINGLEVCRRVREWTEVPIIILSALEGEMDKVKCLDCGADDYLTKPFSLKELLARIKAVIRRSQPSGPASATSRFVKDDLVIDFAGNTVTLRGQTLDLTAIENKILCYLAINEGRIITPNQLLEHVWGEGYVGDYSVLQVNICRLRAKIQDEAKNPHYIKTKPGIGYMFIGKQE